MVSMGRLCYFEHGEQGTHVAGSRFLIGAVPRLREFRIRNLLVIVELIVLGEFLGLGGLVQLHEHVHG